MAQSRSSAKAAAADASTSDVTGVASGKAQKLWDRVESLARKIARDEIAAALGNTRPGGAASIALSVGAPGIPLVASSLSPWLFARVDFPVLLDQLHIVADVIGTAEFDIWVQRPGQTADEATSITGGAPVQLVASRETVLSPIVDAWATRNIEAGSVISVFVTDTDGLISIATLNLRGKCT